MDEEHQEEQLNQEGEAQPIIDFGSSLIHSDRGTVYVLTIVGQIEGHQLLPPTSKSTKYEHVLPKLAELESSKDVGGLLVVLNTQGGDVDAGLAIAEMIASMSIPTVSLVLGGSHSIGVPLAVSADYSFIVPTGTMLIHPVRMSGMVIGAPQTYDYFKRIQDRITGFIASHSDTTQEQIEAMMMETGEMTKDLGRILVGEDAVKEGLINEVGGIHDALEKLKELMKKREEQEEKEEQDINS